MSDTQSGYERFESELAAVAAEMTEETAANFGNFSRRHDGYPFSNVLDSNEALLARSVAAQPSTRRQIFRRRARMAHDPTLAASSEPVRTPSRMRRWGATIVGLAVLGTIGVIGVAHMPDEPPAAYKRIPPAVLEAALASDALLLATGTCAAELETQARIDETFLNGNRGAVDKKYWNRPDLYRAAAQRAMTADVPCSPPATNPKAGYELPGGPGYDSQVLYGYDVVNVELGDTSWCITRGIMQAMPPTGGLDLAYQNAELTVGNQAAAAHSIVC